MNERQQKAIHLYCDKGFFNLEAQGIYADFVRDYFTQALFYDLAPRGDITSEALFDRTQQAGASIVVKGHGVVAGLEEVAWVLGRGLKLASGRKFEPMKIRTQVQDGNVVEPGTVVAEIQGVAVDILAFERTLLNLLQRMSGVATNVWQYTQFAKNTLVVPTRKTLIGYLDKKACMFGGAGTHRMNLSDAILVKDNHFDVGGRNLKHVFEHVMKTQAHPKFIEIEVDSPDEGLKILELYGNLLASADMLPIPFCLMLDNFSVQTATAFMNAAKQTTVYDHVLFEASGGIHLQNIAEYDKTGVDILSVGALTHSAPALDISLEIFPA